MKSKKAIVPSALAMFVLGTVVCVVLLLMTPRIISITKSLSDNGVCSNEAVLKDFTNSLSTTGVAGYLLPSASIYLKSCKIDQKIITKKDYPTKKDVDKYFADQSYSCFQQFRDLQVFPNNDQFVRIQKEAKDNDAFFQIRDEERLDLRPITCAICAKVVFEPDYAAELAAQQEGAGAYLSYLEYLRNTTKFGAYETMYSALDEGRYTGDGFSQDLTQKYIYGGDSQNVVLFYRRAAGTTSLEEVLTWDGWDDWDDDIYPKISDLFDDGNNYLYEWEKKAKIDLREAYKKGDNHPFTVGAASYFVSGNRLWLPLWFTPFREDNPLEYGVATVPYEFVAHQCDYLANGYGAIS